jgi:glutamate synthase domain-containing protein 2/uncharacterized Fe-S cluster protein YjdI
MGNDKKIEATENGPYIVKNIKNLHTSGGERIETSDTMALCRCGQSNAKPNCDGSHIKVEFKSAKIEGRQPRKVDDYEGKDITIHDNRGICAHIGHCSDNAPNVFRMKTEPWIDPDGEPTDEVKRVVGMCPSGALSFSLDGKKVDSQDREPGIHLLKNGPYFVVGGVALDDCNGDKPESTEHFAMCRCGGSKNKPFCDGSHWYNKFDHDESTVPLEGKKKIDLADYLGNLKRPCDGNEDVMADIHRMSVTGESIIEPMRTKKKVVSWDDIIIKGAQLARIPLNKEQHVNATTVIGPKAKHPLVIESPVYITHMSFGALSREVKESLARGSAAVKTVMCSGEGGILEESIGNAYKYIYEYIPNKYSFSDENLKRVDAVEIKIGQSAKPGMGGHLPGKKVTAEIAQVRGIKEGKDIHSPAHYEEIQDMEGLRSVVSMLREKTGGKPIGVKIAAGNIEDDLEVATYAQPDFITIDGRPGATAAAPKMVKDSASVPTIYALYRARKFFAQRNIKGISLVITGGFRTSADFAKALAMGADAVAIGTAALMAAACQQYQICDSGDCPVGVTTQREVFRSRLDIERSAKKVENFLRVSIEELKDFARLTGNDDVHKLSMGDIETTNSEISTHTDIPHC